MEVNFETMRVLALDLHASRYGFAVLEGPSRLLDWGASTYSWTERGISLGCLSPLFTIFRPQVLAIGDVADWSATRRKGSVPAVQRVYKEVNWKSIPLQRISRNEIRNLFAAQTATTKHDISATITLLFPELVWRLPRPRKPWESEPSSQTIFDAVTLAVTCLGRFGDLGLRERISGEYEEAK